MQKDFQKMIESALFPTSLRQAQLSLLCLQSKLIVGENDESLKSLKSLKNNINCDSKFLFQNQNILLQKILWK